MERNMDLCQEVKELGFYTDCYRKYVERIPFMYCAEEFSVLEGYEVADDPVIVSELIKVKGFVAVDKSAVYVGKGNDANININGDLSKYRTPKLRLNDESRWDEIKTLEEYIEAEFGVKKGYQARFEKMMKELRRKEAQGKEIERKNSEKKLREKNSEKT